MKFGEISLKTTTVLRYYATRNIQYSVSAMANSKLVLGKNQNTQTVFLVFSTFFFLVQPSEGKHISKTSVKKIKVRATFRFLKQFQILVWCQPI